MTMLAICSPQTELGQVMAKKKVIRNGKIETIVVDAPRGTIGEEKWYMDVWHKGEWNDNLIQSWLKQSAIKT